MSHHIAVIGAGPGGYAAAFYAADLGMQVTLIDNEKNPGGVCLYRGCIPSKALLHVAKLLEESKHAKEWGIEFGDAKVDIDKLRDYKNRVVEKLTSGTGQVSKFRKVNYIQGWASIVDAKTIKVKKGDATEEIVNVDYMILALGSLPTKIPSLSINSPRVLDSTGALDLPEIPKSMLVIGGGYIGLELGSVYAALGTKVSVVEMTPGLLPGADRDLVRFLAQRVEKTFEKVMVSTKVTSMKADDRSVTVNFEGEGAPKEAVYDYVLVSIGRRPNAKIDGLDRTKVKVDAQGLHRDRRPAPHRGADHLRDRRRRRRADARAQGVARGARRGGSDRRAEGGVRAGGDSRGGLHRSRDRVGRHHRSRSREAGPQGRSREVPVAGIRPRDRDRSRRRHDEADHRSRDRAHPRRRHRGIRRRRADRRRRRRDRDGR